MESKGVNVLDVGHQIVVDPKRKQPAEHAANVSEASHKAFLLRLKHGSSLCKRKRSVACKGKCGLQLQKSVTNNYTNFMRSGLPKRVLFYQNGEWNDFPQDVVQLVRAEFNLKKSAVEVQSNDGHLMLDILYMIQVDMQTGSQKPIAWIDEAGGCFFPQMYSADAELHEHSKSELEKDECVCGEPNGTHELKLLIQIEGVNNCLEECVGESNTSPKRIKMNQNSRTNDLELGADDRNNENYDMTMENVVDKVQKIGENPSLKNEYVFEIIDVDCVRKMFFEGMKPTSGINIHDISKCSSSMMRTCWEIFQKQVEITQKYRGDPNIHYAWLATTKDVLSSTMAYGLAHCRSMNIATYGLGVHLTSERFAACSANYCDADENGLRYIVFCRVILGNVELVHRGSTQCYPSSENFDNGVDDMQNPIHYIVWNMNMNTHIYPEYVVSFRMLHSEAASLIGKELQSVVPEVTPCVGHSDQAKIGSSVVESGKANSSGLTTAKTPKSPWLPFTMLFDALSPQLSQAEMNRVYSHYGELKSKKITRDDFIKMLRLIAGDQLLKTTMLGLQSQLPPNAKHVPAVPKGDRTS